MDPNRPLEDRPDETRRVTAIEKLGRAERHFRFLRALLIGLGIFFIVGSLTLYYVLAINSATDVFTRHTDQIEEVNSPPKP